LIYRVDYIYKNYFKNTPVGWVKRPLVNFCGF
jgi:hypothetical protein